MGQKYQLINIETGDKHLCKKVTESGTEYYVKVNKEKVELDRLYYEPDNNIPIYSFTPETLPSHYYLQRVIATTNEVSDLPKVVDGIKFLGIKTIDEKSNLTTTPERVIALTGYYEGYSQHAEKFPFSEDDLVEFHKWAFYQVKFNPSDKKTKELLTNLKSLRPKVIYFK